MGTPCFSYQCHSEKHANQNTCLSHFFIVVVVYSHYERSKYQGREFNRGAIASVRSFFLATVLYMGVAIAGYFHGRKTLLILVVIKQDMSKIGKGWGLYFKGQT